MGVASLLLSIAAELLIMPRMRIKAPRASLPSPGQRTQDTKSTSCRNRECAITLRKPLHFYYIRPFCLVFVDLFALAQLQQSNLASGPSTVKFLNVGVQIRDSNPLFSCRIARHQPCSLRASLATRAS